MITKGKFKDGTIGWKVDDRITNGVKGFEIHWSDDGECVTDHVYEIEDAKLIAAAPELLEALQSMKIMYNTWLKQDENTIGFKCATKAMAAIKKATD